MKQRRPEITEQEAECRMRKEDERASRRLSVAVAIARRLYCGKIQTGKSKFAKLLSNYFLLSFLVLPNRNS